MIRARIAVWGFLAMTLSVLMTGCDGKEKRIARHLEKGNASFQKADYEKARIEFKNVLKMDPKNISALFAQALVQEKLKNWREAAGFYRAVLEQQSNHVGANSKLSRIMYMARAHDQALELAEMVLKEKPQDAQALAVRGSIKALRKDLPGAISDAQAALKAEPGHADAAVLLTSLYQQNKQEQEAVNVLKGAIAEHNPQEIALTNLLAQIYAKQGNTDETIRLLRSVIQKEPKNIAHRVQLARFFVMLKKDGEAEQVMREAVKDDPDNVESKLHLINYLSSKKSKESAEQELLAFIAREPNQYSLRFNLAALYESMRDLDKTQQQYQEIIKLDDRGPDGLKARSRLAMTFVQQQKIEEAKLLLNEVLQENSKDNEALMLRGKIFLRQNNFSGAVADFRSILRAQPDSTEVMLLLARAHVLNKESSLAIDTLKKAISINPKSSVLQIELTQVLLQSGQVQPAIKQIEEALKVVPEKLALLENLFQIQMGQRDFASAQQTADKIIALDSTQALGYYLSGLTQQVQSQHDSAIKQFETALQQSSERAEVFPAVVSALVKSMLVKKKPDQVIARLNVELKKRPNNFIAHNLYGELLLSQKKPDQAIVEFQKVIKINPAFSIAYRNLGVANLAHQDKNAAIAVLREGIKVGNDPEMLYITLASWYEAWGDYDTAITEYKAAYHAQQNSPRLANNLAMLLVSYKQDQASLDLASNLIQKLSGTENPAYLDTIGWVQYKRGDFNNAVTSLEQAIQIAQDEPLLNYHLGMARFKKGETELARQNLKKSLEAKVEFNGINEARAVLAKIDGS